MKKTFLAIAAILTVMSCNNKKEPVSSGYVGPSDIQVVDGKMTPETLLAFGRLGDPQMSPDGSLILYGVSYTDVKENRTCRNLFVCKPDGSDRKQISRYAKSVSNARWSADGKWIYFLQGGQLYRASFNGIRLGKMEKLSDIEAGIDEFKFNAAQNAIIFTSTIKNKFVDQPKDICEDLDKAQAYATEDLMYRHWDHWVTETPRSYYASLQNGLVTADNSIDLLGDEPFELPTEPFGGVEQLDWSPDGRYIVYSCRKLMGKEYAFSTNSCIYIYDLLTGDTRAVTTSGGYDTDPAWSPDGSKIAFISMERDGYEADRQRLMVADLSFVTEEDCQCFGVNVDGIRELTKDFIYDVASICWAEDSKSLFFSYTKKACDFIARASAEGAPEISDLTGSDWRYGFSAPFAVESDGNGALRLYTTYQSMEFPAELACVSVSADGQASLAAVTTENKHILDQISEITMDQIVIKTPQGEDLYCWVLYPPHFDASKTYAGVEMFNGGPQTSLDQHWSYRWNFFLMAQQGYVVLLPNRHGDSGFGQPWKEQISGDYQGLNMQDYMLAAKWFKAQSWAGKLAGVGASYGGFSVYNMMGIHGDLFDCFISHAGIFDEKIMWYTTEEAWFGNWDNGGLTEYAYEAGKVGPAGDGVTFGGLQQAGAPYAKGAKVAEHYGNDPSANVTKWHTPILCIHGMMDFRIPYTQGMAAFNAAQMMGVPSRLVIFPEECHWILQPQNSLYWHREFYGWLDKWL